MIWATKFMIMNKYQKYQTAEQTELSKTRKTPPQVQNALYSKWWFKPAWRQMHYSNAGNNLGVVVGANGTGKSWLLLWVAEQLGYDKGGRPRLFDPDNLEEHVCFDAVSFSDIVSKLMKKPKRQTVGYQIILDEGQIALYSKEAFNKEVKNLSKLLMTVRSRRWGIYINLPSFKMLNKDVRTITNWMVWMKGKPSEFSYGTYYDIQNNMMDGEVYLKKPVFAKNVSVKDGLPLNIRVANKILSFPKPSKKTISAYESMKAEHQRELYKKFNKEMHAANMTDEDKINLKEIERKKETDELVSKALELRSRIWTERYGWANKTLCSALGIGVEKARKVQYAIETREREGV